MTLTDDLDLYDPKLIYFLKSHFRKSTQSIAMKYIVYIMAFPELHMTQEKMTLSDDLDLQSHKVTFATISHNSKTA